MNPGLWLLIALRFKGWLRKLGRTLLTIKGALLATVGLLVLLPNLLLRYLSSRMTPDIAVPAATVQIDGIRKYGPLVMLVYCVTTLLLSKGERALYFTPAEVNFLFPGPFSRRQLIGYKVAVAAGISLVMAAFMELFFRNDTPYLFFRNDTPYLSAYLGIFNATMFVQLFSMAIALASSTAGEFLYTRARTSLALILGLAVAGAIFLLRDQLLSLPPQELLATFEGSTAGRALVAPFRPFLNTYTAQRIWPDLIQSASLGLLINMGLFGLVMVLDANYIETSAAISAKIYAMFERARRGGSISTPGRPGKVPFRLPSLPWWHGVGPVAWRQLTGVSRDPFRIFLMSIFFLAIGGPLFVTLPIEAVSLELLLPLLMIVGVPLLLTPLMTFDFRSDVDRIEQLKTLPIAPTSMVIGQIFTPVLVLSLFEWVALALCWSRSVEIGPAQWIIAALVVPCNALMVEADNLLFLWFPSRVVGANPGDIQAMGRNILLMFGKFLLLSAALTATALAALLLSLVREQKGWEETLVLGFLSLSILALAILPLVASAFKNFDVSRAIPG